MKSATRANSTTVRLTTKWMNFESYSFRKFCSVLTLLLLTNFGFAQQKNLNASELQQSLTEVNVSIQEVEQKIAHINSRLEGIPLENIDPQLITRLDDLEVKKNQLERRKISIQAALTSVQNSNDPNDFPSELESVDANNENY